MEVRTKPTMYQRMLRSGLAVAFTAGLTLGAVAALDNSWSSGTAREGEAAGLAAGDISWSAPKSASTVATMEDAADGDISWSFLPVSKGV
jgi:hypothetical protein